MTTTTLTLPASDLRRGDAIHMGPNLFATITAIEAIGESLRVETPVAALYLHPKTATTIQRGQADA